MVDSVLGGRLLLSQAATGHRAGTDAMLLVAAAGAGQARRIVDLGSGVGTIGLALIRLGRASHATLVERDAGYAALARQNIALNGFASQAHVVEADIAARAAQLVSAGLATGEADLVLANPPFNTPGRHRASPDQARASAHAMQPEEFDAWTRTAARSLRPDGRFILIHRPEALVWLLPMLARRFAALTVVPVHSRQDEAASRVLVGASLNSKTPARVLPALVLHEPDGVFTELGTAIHAGEAQLDLR